MNDEEEEESALSDLVLRVEAASLVLNGLSARARDDYTNSKNNERESVRISAKHAELEKLRQQVRAAEEEIVREEEAEAVDVQTLRSTSDLRTSISTCQSLLSEIAVCERERVKVEEESVKMQFLLEARQLKLLSELQSIYPIERISGDREKERHTIRGIELLPPLDGSQRDDEQISTALGYVVHLLLLVSKYLEIPLRYQLLFYASRSIIRDPVQKDPKDQNLPLYRKDVEPERFKRAFQWLSKDVEQLLLARQIKYEGNRDLLANLSRLFHEEMLPK